MDYPQIERRKDYITMNDRLLEAEDKIDKLNNELTILNTELPYIKKSIDELTNQIKTHESNACMRQEASIKCRDARVEATNSIRWLWLIVSTILITNIGMVVHLLTRK